MVAGGSAMRRSRELDREADALISLESLVRKKARNYQLASYAESSLAGRLRALPALGWTVLEDRLWPGSKRANVDFIAVGPGGVVVLDSKSWAELTIRGDGLYRGDSREDGELEKLAALVDQLADALSPTGLTRNAITAAMVFTGRSLRTTVGPITILGENDVATHLAGLRTRITPDQIELLCSALEACCPPIPEVASTPPPPRLRGLAAPEPEPALFDSEDLVGALLESALAEPIEGWMTFLHPEQNHLIKSRWNGPARVRGPAGTGKTVVGLHRAVYLAQRSKHPVLFVSYVKTLPLVLASLATRLSPTAAENITFIGIHALAYRCLETVGLRPQLDSRQAAMAFDQAWSEAASSAKVLSALEQRSSYWRDEIDHVIKGRGISSFEQYATLVRVGRKMPMRVEQRQAMWDIFCRYEAQLQARGVEDFNDLLIRARAVVEGTRSLFKFSSVIIDEVQDLNLVGVQFLSAFVDKDDGPDRFLLIGDGQQSVYPGGFTLGEAGISVVGRASVLKHNYRNTVEILREASTHIASDTFDDLDGVPELGTRVADVSRHGYQPIKVHARTRADLDAALSEQIRATHDILYRPWGDMAVLVEGAWGAARYRDYLTAVGIPCVDLLDYDGQTTDRVKVGTIKRAKGLEFAFVLLPGLRDGGPTLRSGETAEFFAERCERWRRELFVAMTRARDGLWLGYVA